MITGAPMCKAIFVFGFPDFDPIFVDRTLDRKGVTW